MVGASSILSFSGRTPSLHFFDLRGQLVTFGWLDPAFINSMCFGPQTLWVSLHFCQAPSILSSTLHCKRATMPQKYSEINTVYVLSLCVLAGRPVMIVVEYMENGSLDSFLRVSVGVSQNSGMIISSDSLKISAVHIFTASACLCT